MSNIEGYRENLAEAQRDLEIAESIVAEFKARDMIVWGTTPKGFEGWLVKGAKADQAYSNRARVRSDIEHWHALIAGELKREAAERPPSAADLNAQFAAKFPEADRRLPPEREDDEEVSP